MGVDADDPFSVAVTTALEFAAIAPVLIANTALAAPCETVTDAGTVSEAELEASVTVAPPSSAARLKKTKQFVELEGCNDAILHRTTVTLGCVLLAGAVSEMPVDADDPFSEAVSVAVEFVVIAPALTLNEALAAPCGTVIEAGTVMAVELEVSAIAAPPGPTVLLRATEQEVEPEPLSELLPHDIPVTVTGLAAGA
jgi:hypothetical protein